MASSGLSATLAPNLSSAEDAYLIATFQQYVQALGTTITYMTQTTSGTSAYGQPNISYISSSITGVVTNLSKDEYQFVEPGLWPSHYAHFWVYQLIPQVGDRVLWHQIEWEIRNSFPMIIGQTTVYYKCLIRRVLVGGTLQAGG